MSEARFTPHAGVQAVEAMPGVVRRTVGWGERMLIAEFTMAKGSVIPEHSHPHEQIGHVVSGRIEFRSGSASEILGPGDGYCFPSGVPHAVVALEDSVAVDVFSPVREEYK